MKNLRDKLSAEIDKKMAEDDAYHSRMEGMPDNNSAGRSAFEEGGQFGETNWAISFEEVSR